MRVRASIALMAGIAALSGCGSSDTKTVTVSAPSSTAAGPTTATTAPPAQPTPPKDHSCAALVEDPSRSGPCDLGQTPAIVEAAGHYVTLSDLAFRVRSVRVAKTVPAISGIPARTAKGTFVILKVQIKNISKKPLDWGNALDGRTQLFLGDKTFNHDGNAEANLPGTLYAESIPPDGNESRWLVYDVTKPSIGKVRSPQALLGVISTEQLEQGNDPSTATFVGLAHLPD
jgi:hypothetical protein